MNITCDWIKNSSCFLNLLLPNHMAVPAISDDHLLCVCVCVFYPLHCPTCTSFSSFSSSSFYSSSWSVESKWRILGGGQFLRSRKKEQSLPEEGAAAALLQNVLAKGLMGHIHWALRGVEGAEADWGGATGGHPTISSLPSLCLLIHSHIIYKRICAS